MKFSDFIDVRDGTHESPKATDKGKKLITTKNLSTNHIDFSNAKNISVNDFNHINERSNVEKYDILLSMIGTVGNVYQEKNDNPDYAIKNLALLKFHGDELLSNWMNYYLQSEDGQNKIKQKLNGSTQQFISLKELRNLEIELPTKKEMETKSRPLNLIDGLIQKNNQINDNLLELISSIWENQSADIHNKITLKRLAKMIITGKTPSTKVKENYGTDIPFVKIPDMRNKVFIDEASQNLSIFGANSQKNKYIPENSIIVSCIGTPGLVSLIGRTVQTNQQINSLILDNKYIYCTYLELKSLKYKIRNLSSGGTTIKNLNKTDFGNIRITVPNKDSQLDRFNRIAKPIFEKIHVNNIELQNLVKVKEVLLGQYF